jgi:hypothetical protein
MEHDSRFEEWLKKNDLWIGVTHSVRSSHHRRQNRNARHKSHHFLSPFRKLQNGGQAIVARISFHMQNLSFSNKKQEDLYERPTMALAPLPA